MAVSGRGIPGADANTSISTGLTQEVQTYYEKVFLVY